MKSYWVRLFIPVFIFGVLSVYSVLTNGNYSELLKKNQNAMAFYNDEVGFGGYYSPDDLDGDGLVDSRDYDVRGKCSGTGECIWSCPKCDNVFYADKKGSAHDMVGRCTCGPIGR